MGSIKICKATKSYHKAAKSKRESERVNLYAQSPLHSACGRMLLCMRELHMKKPTNMTGFVALFSEFTCYQAIWVDVNNEAFFNLIEYHSLHRNQISTLITILRQTAGPPTRLPGACISPGRKIANHPLSNTKGRPADTSHWQKSFSGISCLIFPSVPR